MKKADIIGFLDGDLGNTASEVEKLITPIINNECDVTIAKFPPAKKKGGLGFVDVYKRQVLQMKSTRDNIVIGIDTSCYTTSIAAISLNKEIIFNEKIMLNVCLLYTSRCV